MTHGRPGQSAVQRALAAASTMIGALTASGIMTDETLSNAGAEDDSNIARSTEPSAS